MPGGRGEQPITSQRGALGVPRFGAAYWSAVLMLSAVFGAIAWGVVRSADFSFDRPLLLWMHAHASSTNDAAALLISRLGYAWGVIPLDVASVLALLALGRQRGAVFAALGMVGGALLNVACKHLFQRERPALWESIAPETTFSFPSAHSMGSATLVAIWILLAWHSLWRWPVAVAGVSFVLLVGCSRVYLGVHYPSDVLAGWSLGLAWVLAVYAALHQDQLPSRCSSVKKS